MSLSVDGRKATESMEVTKAGIFVFGSLIFIEIYERSRSFDSWLVKRKMPTIPQVITMKVALLFVSCFMGNQKRV